MANSFYTTNPYMMRAFLTNPFNVDCSDPKQAAAHTTICGAKKTVNTIQNADQAAKTVANPKQTVNDLLDSPEINTKVNNLVQNATKNAVSTGLQTAKDDIFGGIFGFMGSLGQYTPYILVGAGLIAVIMLMW